MIELRFTAEKPNGQPIGGSLTALTYSQGKQKIKLLAEKNKLRITKVEKKSTFFYKVKRNNAIIKGEQKAYTKEEVQAALEKLGYEVVSINKALFELSGKPPFQEVVSFVKISADLLEQKLQYSEVLNLLMNDMENKALRETLKDINNELKRGADSQTTFMRHEGIFGKFTAYMLGLASKSGNMTEIYRATAKFLERQQEFQKNLRSALITPIVTMFVLFLAVIFYVGYIFPETAKLFIKFDIPLPTLTAGTLILSNFLVNNIVIIMLLSIAPFVGIYLWYRTKNGQLFIDKTILKMPVVGTLMHKTVIEVFCRVFYTLYTGAAESIEPIRVASEATGNAYFEDRIKNIAIPLMIKKGAGVTEAFEASGVFTETAISRFHSGEETGTIKNTALQLANYYESETVYKLKNIIELVQVVIAMAIMIVMIFLTIVSAETATINPKNPMMKGFILDYVKYLFKMF